MYFHVYLIYRFTRTYTDHSSVITKCWGFELQKQKIEPQKPANPCDTRLCSCIFSVNTRQKNFPLLYGRGKFFIQLFPPVMGSCSPPTDVKMRRPVYDLGYHESFDCNNFLGIYSKTSRSYSCLQRKLPLQELVETLVHLRSQFCEHGLHHQRLHHIEQQRKSYTHPQMCRTNIL